MDVGAKSLGEHLRHHGEQPQDAGRDMHAVASDQRKEGRQEGAARRARAARDEIGELVKLDPEEGETEDAGHGHRDLEPEMIALLGGDARHAAGEARQQQAARSRPRHS